MAVKLSTERRLTALEQRVTAIERLQGDKPPAPPDFPAPTNDDKPYHILVRSRKFAVEVDNRHRVLLVAPDGEKFAVMSVVPPPHSEANVARWILEKEEASGE
jgi:hypothetical protein